MPDTLAKPCSVSIDPRHRACPHVAVGATYINSDWDVETYCRDCDAVLNVEPCGECPDCSRILPEPGSRYCATCSPSQSGSLEFRRRRAPLSSPAVVTFTADPATPVAMRASFRLTA